MKLAEFLKLTGMPKTELARRTGLTFQTINNILNESFDMKLSTAIKIDKETKGQVTCYDLINPKFLER